MAVLMTARGPTWLLLAAALPFLLMFAIRPVRSAPVYEDEQHHQLESYNDDTGCYYNYQHYGEGDRIITNEPCLNCTCHNRMLMCYLRVCPFTKAIGSDCTVEKKADQCCPVITCPEVPVQLLSHQPSSTTMRPQASTAVGHRDTYGCTIDSEFFADGAQIPSEHNKPCELCYCIRNHTACVMQECTLNVEGCRPVYQDGVCCPVRYECDYPEDPTTIEPGTGGGLILTTTTTMSPNLGCRYNEDEYADGALIHMDDKPCEHCYCMRGDIVCAVQECGTPLEKEGHNCTAIPPQPGKCCPEMYQCDTGIEYVTDASFRMNRKQYGNTYDDSLNEPMDALPVDASIEKDPGQNINTDEPIADNIEQNADEPQTINTDHSITSNQDIKPETQAEDNNASIGGVALDAGDDDDTSSIQQVQQEGTNEADKVSESSQVTSGDNNEEQEDQTEENEITTEVNEQNEANINLINTPAFDEIESNVDNDETSGQTTSDDSITHHAEQEDTTDIPQASNALDGQTEIGEKPLDDDKYPVTQEMNEQQKPPGEETDSNAAQKPVENSESVESHTEKDVLPEEPESDEPSNAENISELEHSGVHGTLLNVEAVVAETDTTGNHEDVAGNTESIVINTESSILHESLKPDNAASHTETVQENHPPVLNSEPMIVHDGQNVNDESEIISSDIHENDVPEQPISEAMNGAEDSVKPTSLPETLEHNIDNDSTMSEMDSNAQPDTTLSPIEIDNVTQETPSTISENLPELEHDAPQHTDSFSGMEIMHEEQKPVQKPEVDNLVADNVSVNNDHDSNLGGTYQDNTNNVENENSVHSSTQVPDSEISDATQKPEQFGEQKPEVSNEEENENLDESDNNGSHSFENTAAPAFETENEENLHGVTTPVSEPVSLADEIKPESDEIGSNNNEQLLGETENKYPEGKPNHDTVAINTEIPEIHEVEDASTQSDSEKPNEGSNDATITTAPHNEVETPNQNGSDGSLPEQNHTEGEVNSVQEDFTEIPQSEEQITDSTTSDPNIDQEETEHGTDSNNDTTIQPENNAVSIDQESAQEMINHEQDIYHEPADNDDNIFKPVIDTQENIDNTEHQDGSDSISKPDSTKPTHSFVDSTESPNANEPSTGTEPSSEQHLETNNEDNKEPSKENINDNHVESAKPDQDTSMSTTENDSSDVQPDITTQSTEFSATESNQQDGIELNPEVNGEFIPSLHDDPDHIQTSEPINQSNTNEVNTEANISALEGNTEASHLANDSDEINKTKPDVLLENHQEEPVFDGLPYEEDNSKPTFSNDITNHDENNISSIQSSSIQSENNSNTPNIDEITTEEIIHAVTATATAEEGTVEESVSQDDIADHISSDKDSVTPALDASNDGAELVAVEDSEMDNKPEMESEHAQNIDNSISSLIPEEETEVTTESSDIENNTEKEKEHELVHDMENSNLNEESNTESNTQSQGEEQSAIEEVSGTGTNKPDVSEFTTQFTNQEVESNKPSEQSSTVSHITASPAHQDDGIKPVNIDELQSDDQGDAEVTTSNSVSQSSESSVDQTSETQDKETEGQQHDTDSGELNIPEISEAGPENASEIPQDTIISTDKPAHEENKKPVHDPIVSSEVDQSTEVSNSDINLQDTQMQIEGDKENFNDPESVSQEPTQENVPTKDESSETYQEVSSPPSIPSFDSIQGNDVHDDEQGINLDESETPLSGISAVHDVQEPNKEIQTSDDDQHMSVVEHITPHPIPVESDSLMHEFDSGSENMPENIPDNNEEAINYPSSDHISGGVALDAGEATTSAQGSNNDKESSVTNKPSHAEHPVEVPVQDEKPVWTDAENNNNLQTDTISTGNNKPIEADQVTEHEISVPQETENQEAHGKPIVQETDFVTPTPDDSFNEVVENDGHEINANDHHQAVDNVPAPQDNIRENSTVTLQDFTTPKPSQQDSTQDDTTENDNKLPENQENVGQDTTQGVFESQNPPQQESTTQGLENQEADYQESATLDSGSQETATHGTASEESIHKEPEREQLAENVPVNTEPENLENVNHKPSQHEPTQHEPTQHEPTQHEPAEHELQLHEPAQTEPAQQELEQHEPEIHEPVQYEPEKHEPENHEPEQHEPEQLNPEQYKPEQHEPAHDELVTMEPAQHEPVQQDSVQFEPTQHELEQHKPAQQETSEHSNVQQTSVETKPEEPESPLNEPVENEFAEHDPAEHNSAQQEPTLHEPAQHEPAEHEPAQHESEQHEPAQHEPEQQEPAEYKPADHGSVQHEPVQHEPTDNESVQHKPAQHEPADHGSVQHESTEQDTTPQAPAQGTPLETESLQHKPIEHDSVQNKPSELASAEHKPDESAEIESVQHNHEIEEPAIKEPENNESLEGEQHNDGQEEVHLAHQEPIHDFQQHIPSISDIHISATHPAMQDAEETNPDHFSEDMHLQNGQQTPVFSEEPSQVKPGFTPELFGNNDSTGLSSTTTLPDIEIETEDGSSVSTDSAVEKEKHPEGKPGSDIAETSSEEVTESGDVDTNDNATATVIPTLMEGGCNVDGEVFASGSTIKVANPCQESCICDKGIVHCTLRPCPSPPSNNPNCMPMYRDGSCCPIYTCVDEHGQIVTTDDVVVPETGGSMETEDITSAPILEHEGNKPEENIQTDPLQFNQENSKPEVDATTASLHFEEDNSKPESNDGTAAPVLDDTNNDQQVEVTTKHSYIDEEISSPDMSVVTGTSNSEEEILKPENDVTTTATMQSEYENSKPGDVNSPSFETDKTSSVNASNDETETPISSSEDQNPIKEVQDSVKPVPPFVVEPVFAEEDNIEESVTADSITPEAESHNEGVSVIQEETNNDNEISMDSEAAVPIHDSNNIPIVTQDNESKPADDIPLPVTSFEPESTTVIIDDSQTHETSEISKPEQTENTESSTLNSASASLDNAQNNSDEVLSSEITHDQDISEHKPFEDAEENVTHEAVDISTDKIPSLESISETINNNESLDDHVLPIEISTKPESTFPVHTSDNVAHEVENMQSSSQEIPLAHDNNKPGHSTLNDNEHHVPVIENSTENSEEQALSEHNEEHKDTDMSSSSITTEESNGSSNDSSVQSSSSQDDISGEENVTDHNAETVDNNESTSTETDASVIVTENGDTNESESNATTAEHVSTDVQPIAHSEAPVTESNDVSNNVSTQHDNIEHVDSISQEPIMSGDHVETVKDPEDSNVEKPTSDHEAGVPLNADEEEYTKPFNSQSEEENQKPIHHDVEVDHKPETMPHYPDPVLPDMDEDDESMFGGFPDQAPEPGSEFMPPMPSYEDDDHQAAFGPGTCRYGGKVYVSAQQIPRDDPCDFCFCFRSDIICLQQSCPPPIKGCHEEAIDGFCCPRYECPVPMGLMNATTTTTTTTTLPPDLISSYVYGRRASSGCLVQGALYGIGEEITTASGPCLECRCGGDSKMKCEPKACSPQPLLRKMIEAVSLRR